jgi:DNA invertase Pin-like site-specific DNA recombinase
VKLGMVPAAQYLRKSTDQQQYSLEIQSAANETYAQEHAFKIVKTYCDSAK